LILSIVCGIFLACKQEAIQDGVKLGKVNKSDALILMKKVTHDFYCGVDLTMDGIKDLGWIEKK